MPHRVPCVVGDNEYHGTTTHRPVVNTYLQICRQVEPIAIHTSRVSASKNNRTIDYHVKILFIFLIIRCKNSTLMYFLFFLFSAGYSLQPRHRCRQSIISRDIRQGQLLYVFSVFSVILYFFLKACLQRLTFCCFSKRDLPQNKLWNIHTSIACQRQQGSDRDG